MEYRTLGRLGWKVSEIGYGMWGMGGGETGWTGANNQQSIIALNEALSLGCNFFDTAWSYGRGNSESLLGELLRQHPDREIHYATKIPPKNMVWPSTRQCLLEDIFPPDHIREYTEKSLKNLDVSCIDLIQFHVWEDAWAHDERWHKTIEDLKQEGLINAVGISLNTWEPWNGMETLRTGLVDTVQVIYNIFEQSPEAELFPLCEQLNIGVIVRVPFDEGTLTGTLTEQSTWPEGDWRNTFFVPEHLKECVPRAEALKKIVPTTMTMPEMALRFILNNPTVCTVIPGMRTVDHVRNNIKTSDGIKLMDELAAELVKHRWDREPTWWSQ